MEMVRPPTISHIKIYCIQIWFIIQFIADHSKPAWLSGFRCFFNQQTHGLTWQLLEAWNSSRPTCVDAQKIRKPSVTGFRGDWANDLRLSKNKKQLPLQTSFFWQTKRTPLWGRFICGMVEAGLGTWFFVHIFLVHGWVNLPEGYRWYRLC